MDPLQVLFGAFLIYTGVTVYMEVLVARFGFWNTIAVTYIVLWLFGRVLKWSDRREH